LKGDAKKNAHLQRPRSQRAHETVLDAAVELFSENGIERVSMDAIASHSGVSKATIYKHWPDKAALCLEALGRVHGADRELPAFDTGDLQQDLIDFLEHQPPAEYSHLRDKLMPHLIAYAARDREFGKRWRLHVTEPGRVKAVELMDRGIAEGYFPEDLDKSLGLALLIGPMMYKHLFQGTTRMPENLAEGVARAFCRAFSVAPHSGKPTKKSRGK
jgi:AcrR family transcriptional regulator